MLKLTEEGIKQMALYIHNPEYGNSIHLGDNALEHVKEECEKDSTFYPKGDANYAEATAEYSPSITVHTSIKDFLNAQTEMLDEPEDSTDFESWSGFFQNLSEQCAKVAKYLKGEEAREKVKYEALPATHPLKVYDAMRMAANRAISQKDPEGHRALRRKADAYYEQNIKGKNFVYEEGAASGPGVM